MSTLLPPRDTYLQALFDAVPSPIFVVDDDVNILDFNAAAGQFVGAERKEVLRRRGGDVLHCVHAHDDPEGCGRAPACRDCVIRNSVRRAFEGDRTTRARAWLQRENRGGKVGLYALVTVSPIGDECEGLALLILEDITELMELRDMLPICTHCKKIRDDRHYWQAVDAYLIQHLDVSFTHSICPDCMHRLYPDTGDE
jgi:PAS domain-containing protein